MRSTFTFFSSHGLAVIVSIFGLSMAAMAEPVCYFAYDEDVLDLSHLCGQSEPSIEEILPVPPPGEDDFLRGLEHYGNGSTTAAIYSLNRAIAAEPDQVGYYWLRSVIHTENNNSRRRASDDFEALRQVYRRDNQDNPAAMSDEALRRYFFPPKSR